MQYLLLHNIEKEEELLLIEDYYRIYLGDYQLLIRYVIYSYILFYIMRK